MNNERNNVKKPDGTKRPTATRGLDKARRPDAEKGGVSEKMSLFDRIYRTPAVHIASISAISGAAFCLLLAIILLICGFRVVSDVDVEGNTIRYAGIMSEGRPTLGRLYLPNGEKGRVTGDRVKFSDGRRYEGGMEGLVFSGEGTLTDADGNVYSGNFINGLLEGNGTVTYADGSTFAGSFKNGKKDGYGEYMGADGSSYKGNHMNGERWGYGVLIYADGSEYKGSFENGMRHGQGSYRFASGDSYTGQFRNNTIWGQGSYFFASGRVYTGEFRNGIPVIE